MKTYKLTKEEQKILKAVESGTLKSVPNLKKEIARYAQIARAGGAGRVTHVTIPVEARDLRRLKAKAAHIGIPYEQLVSSVIHQYGNL